MSYTILFNFKNKLTQFRIKRGKMIKRKNKEINK
jgi:hypothetical protein